MGSFERTFTSNPQPHQSVQGRTAPGPPKGLHGHAHPTVAGRHAVALQQAQARVHVSAYYPLERAAEAVAAVEDGHATGKVVVTLD